MLCIAIILCIILVLAFLRFWAEVTYEDGETSLYVGLGMLYFAVDLKLDKPKKKKKPKKEKKPSKKPEPVLLEGREKFSAILNLAEDGLDLVSDILGKLGKSILIDKLTIRLRWGADDPCDAAVGYGYACGMLSTLFETIERVISVNERYGGVELDYTIDKPKIYAKASCSLNLKDIVTIAAFTVGAGVKVYRKHEQIVHTLKKGKKAKENRPVAEK